MYRLNNVIKKYSDIKGEYITALDGLNLEIPNKGLVVICGTSGCGKTTLLNILGGLDKPTSGEVYIDNERIDDKDEEWWDVFRGSQLGFIYQDFNLLENVTVYDNIALPLNLHNTDEKLKNDVITAISQELGLNDMLDKDSGKLSGGQKQRVAIARAMASGAKILLADETTGNLDRKNSEVVFQLLKKIASQRLVVVVTHDDILANAYADRIIQIAYGTIESDEIRNDIEKKSITPTDDNDSPNITLKKSVSRLSYKECFMFAKQAMSKRATRCIISVMIFSITTLLILLLSEILFRDDSVPITNYINDHDINVLSLYMPPPDEYSMLVADENITCGKKYYNLLTDCVDKERIIRRVGTYEIQLGKSLINDVTGIDMVEESSEYCTFEGEFPKKENEVAISADVINKVGSSDVSIGSTIIVDDKEYVITAIISQICEKNVENISINIGYGDEPLGSIIVFSYNTDPLCGSGDRVYMPGFGVISQQNLYTQVTRYCDICAANNDTDLIAGRMPQKDNEILISDSFLELNKKTVDDLIGTSYKIDDLYAKKYGSTFWGVINLYDYIGDNFKIVGITSDDGEFFVMPKLFEELYKEYACYNNSTYMLLNNDKTINHDIHNLNNNSIKIFNHDLEQLYSLSYNVDSLAIIFIIGVGIISLLSILQMVSLYSYSINDNKKTIGILRTLGVNKADTMNIFTLECLVVSVISFFVALILNIIFIYAINKFLLDNMLINTGINFIHIRFIVILITLAVTLLLSMLSVIIPLRKYSKIKIIELVK